MSDAPDDDFTRFLNELKQDAGRLAPQLLHPGEALQRGWMLRHRAKRRRRVGAGLVLAVAIVVFLVPLPRLNLFSGGGEAPAAPAMTTAPPVGFITTTNADGHDLIVWSWAGHQIARLHSATLFDSDSLPPSLSPNGRLVMIPAESGDSADVVNLAGQTVGHVNFDDGVWASDSDHFCVLQPLSSGTGGQNIEGELVLAGLNGQSQSLIRLSIGGDHFDSRIGECDITLNRAVVFGNLMGSNRQATEVDLRSGAKRTHRWPAQGVVAISGNGQYVTYGNGDVRNAETGALVAHLTGQPEAISWLGHVVVELAGYSDDGLEAYDWQTGRAIWKSLGPSKCPCLIPGVAATSRPFTDDMALNIYDGPTGLWLISPSKTPRLLSRNVTPGII
jgi:hypothetical protein